MGPPKVSLDDPRHPANDRRYAEVDPALLPSAEHLGDVLARVKVLFDQEIRGELEKRKKLLIVCHGSVVRVLTNILLGFDHQQASEFSVPNATPLVIELDEKLKPQSWTILGDPSKIAGNMKWIENELKSD